MKKSFYILFLLLWLLTACREETAPVPTDTRRTILVYMEAKNNLSDNAQDDLEEMCQATIPSDCRLLAYLSTYGENPILLEVKNGVLDTLLTYEPGGSAVDPAHISRVINDVAKIAPAQDRGLVLWSHAFGWLEVNPFRRSRAFGYENSTHVISNTELARVLEGKGFDFIYFDACFMGSAEVAYELRNCAKWLVASPAETPSPGMPYHLTVPALFDANTERGLRETIDIVADYYEANPDEHRGCPRTLSLIRLDAMDDLARETRRIVELGNEMADGFEPQRYAVSATYRNYFFDLADWVDAIGGDDRWHQALERTVDYERHAPMIWNSLPLVNCCGITVFVPNNGLTYETHKYSDLSWYKYIYNNA